MSMGFLHPSEPLEPSEACPPAGDRRKDRQREADRRAPTGRSSPAGSEDRGWAGRRWLSSTNGPLRTPWGLFILQPPASSRGLPRGGHRPRPGRACVHGQPRPAGQQPGAREGAKLGSPGRCGERRDDGVPGNARAAPGGEDRVCESLCKDGFLL